MTDARPLHERHDPLLVAAHAANDLSGPERDEADRLLTDCLACAELHADLLALSAATRTLPAPARTRDYALSPDDAARLRAGGWRRLLGRLAGPRFALARPVGAAFATLGVAGLLLASLPGVPLAGSAGAPAGAPLTYEAASAPTENRGGAAVQDDRLHATVQPEPIVQAPAAGGAGEGAGAGGGGDITGDLDATARDEALAQRPADATMAILSGSFLIVGIVLLGLRWTAGRLGD